MFGAKFEGTYVKELKKTFDKEKQSKENVMPDFFKDLPYDKNIDINHPVCLKK